MAVFPDRGAVSRPSSSRPGTCASTALPLVSACPIRNGTRRDESVYEGLLVLPSGIRVPRSAAHIPGARARGLPSPGPGAGLVGAAARQPPRIRAAGGAAAVRRTPSSLTAARRLRRQAPSRSSRTGSGPASTVPGPSGRPGGRPRPRRFDRQLGLTGQELVTAPLRGPPLLHAGGRRPSRAKGCPAPSDAAPACSNTPCSAPRGREPADVVWRGTHMMSSSFTLSEYQPGQEHPVVRVPGAGGGDASWTASGRCPGQDVMPPPFPSPTSGPNAGGTAVHDGVVKSPGRCRRRPRKRRPFPSPAVLGERLRAPRRPAHQRRRPAPVQRPAAQARPGPGGRRPRARRGATADRRRDRRAAEGRGTGRQTVSPTGSPGCPSVTPWRTPARSRPSRTARRFAPPCAARESACRSPGNSTKTRAELPAVGAVPQ